jgi:2,3-dihydroxybenzoate decarboxylase
MDAAGVDVQVLSLTVPGCERFDAADGTAMARQTNDELAETLRRYPDRYIGLAALAPQDAAEAAKELERSIKKLNMRGAKINSHVRGEYLDDQKFWVLFEAAESLDVPIYLHPTLPAPSILKPYADYGFPQVKDRHWPHGGGAAFLALPDRLLLAETLGRRGTEAEDCTKTE